MNLNWSQSFFRVRNICSQEKKLVQNNKMVFDAFEQDNNIVLCKISNKNTQFRCSFVFFFHISLNLSLSKLQTALHIL
jgi:hypothetical protein